MIVGIVSDTHGYYHPALDEAFADVDLIVHAGDVGTAEARHPFDTQDVTVPAHEHPGPPRPEFRPDAFRPPVGVPADVRDDEREAGGVELRPLREPPPHRRAGA